MIRALCILVALASGCGGEERAPAAGDAVTLEVATEATADGRLVVATVDGRPVYDDCVRVQARAHGLSAREALAECVDFELLAQAAEARGYATHPAVRETARTEMVRAIIDRDFVADLSEPADLPEGLLRKAYEQNRARRYYRPEYRFAVYARADVPKNAPPAVDRQARKLATDVHRALLGRRDLDIDAFASIAREAAGERPLSLGLEPFDFPRRGRADPVYADAAFAIPEVGMVSPPTRTPWGWDVILLTKILPEKDISLEEATPELFAKLRANAFANWLDGKVDPEDAVIDQAWLERLGRADEHSRQNTYDPVGDGP